MRRILLVVWIVLLSLTLTACQPQLAGFLDRLPLGRTAENLRLDSADSEQATPTPGLKKTGGEAPVGLSGKGLQVVGQVNSQTGNFQLSQPGQSKPGLGSMNSGSNVRANSQANLEIIDPKATLTPDKTKILVIGEVLNNSTQWLDLSNLRLVVSFYNEEGQLVQTGDAAPRLTRIGPGEKAPFKVEAEMVPDIHNFNIRGQFSSM